MRRTTVGLPDELDAGLRHEAKRRDPTIADIIRTALGLHLGGGEGRRLGTAVAGHSEHSNVSRRIEEILSSEMSASH